MLRNKTFAPEFCSLISNWFDMRVQAPGANRLHDSVSWASSLVCTEICFAGACLRSKLSRVSWNLLCGSMFQEQDPSCVLVGVLTRERVSGASSFVCTGWNNLPGSVFQEQATSCVPAFRISRMLYVDFGWASGISIPSLPKFLCTAGNRSCSFTPVDRHCYLENFNHSQITQSKGTLIIATRGNGKLYRLLHVSLVQLEQKSNFLTCNLQLELLLCFSHKHFWLHAPPPEALVTNCNI